MYLCWMLCFKSDKWLVWWLYNSGLMMDKLPSVTMVMTTLFHCLWKLTVNLLFFNYLCFQLLYSAYIAFTTDYLLRECLLSWSDTCFTWWMRHVLTWISLCYRIRMPSSVWFWLRLESIVWPATTKQSEFYHLPGSSK